MEKCTDNRLSARENTKLHCVSDVGQRGCASRRFQTWINLFLAIELRLKEMSTLFVYTEGNTIGL
jgi:hypothetical protein